MATPVRPLLESVPESAFANPSFNEFETSTAKIYFMNNAVSGDIGTWDAIANPDIVSSDESVRRAAFVKQGMCQVTSPFHKEVYKRDFKVKSDTPVFTTELKTYDLINLKLSPETTAVLDAFVKMCIADAYQNRVKIWGPSAAQWSEDVVKFKFTLPFRLDEKTGNRTGEVAVRCHFKPSNYDALKAEAEAKNKAAPFFTQVVAQNPQLLTELRTISLDKLPNRSYVCVNLLLEGYTVTNLGPIYPRIIAQQIIRGAASPQVGRSREANTTHYTACGFTVNDAPMDVDLEPSASTVSGLPVNYLPGTEDDLGQYASNAGTSVYH